MTDDTGETEALQNSKFKIYNIKTEFYVYEILNLYKIKKLYNLLVNY